MKKKGKGKKYYCHYCGGYFRLNTKGVLRSHSINKCGILIRSFPQCNGMYSQPNTKS